MEDKSKPVTVFIIEILKSYEWERSRQFPNYYTEGEADDILRRNPSLTISGDFFYRKREIEYDVAPVKPCTLPPFGWRCTRGFHEDGPCAAVPTVNPSWLGKTISVPQGTTPQAERPHCPTCFSTDKEIRGAVPCDRCGRECKDCEDSWHRAVAPEAESKTTWIKPPLPAGVEDTPEVRRASDALDNNLALG